MTDANETWGSARLSRGLIAATALAIAGLISFGTAPASAAPARYVFEMCDSALPGGGDAGTHFAVNPGVALTPTDSCAQPGGYLGITDTGHVSSTYAFWSLPIGAPPGGKMESVTVSGASCNAGPKDAGAWAEVFGSGWPDYCHPEHPITYQLDSAWGIFWILLGCDGNYLEGCEAGPWVYAHYFATTEIDPVPPTVGAPEGTLLEGPVVRGHQTLAAQASDEGGGVSEVSVLVNGVRAGEAKVSQCDTTYAQNASVIGTVAAKVTPCPTSVNASWNLATQAYPFRNGENTVAVCASDFATLSNPNTTCSQATTINVDNTCTESAISGGNVLSADFAQSNAETVTVGYGQGAAVEGRLATNAGDPVPGATICVKQQTLGAESASTSIARVKTDNSGHYSYEVPPGPNRELTVGYRHDSNQVAREVRYYAHTRPSLDIAPRHVRNGHRIRLWGSVPGPNAGGRVVVLQASAPGSKRWLTFRKATSAPNGDFSSRYWFSHTTRPTTYRIRAVVPAQAGYPWIEGAGKPVRVRVSR